MIVAMKAGASAQEIQQVMDRISGHGLKPVDLPGGAPR